MIVNCHQCIRCFREHRPRINYTKPIQPPIPPRCLLLGATGSGKTTFLFRVKTGEYFDVQPTRGSNVEEVLVTSKTSLVLSDIGGSDRREVRLHFLHSVPILDLSILFFIDASAPLAQLSTTLEDLAYHVTYARNRAGGTRYVGIVLNKQDLLESTHMRMLHLPHSLGGSVGGSTERLKEYDGAPLNDRDTVVQKIKEGVSMVMEQVMTTPLLNADEDTMRWEILDGGARGISSKTGAGVKDVFDTVARAVFGTERAGLLDMVTSGPTGFG